ncbi:rRNA maturation RNase YbeY [Roseobacter sp.]|uniref:rRNA maturation RNase YbeY n=1 Tax=Roseobacter sp. TaxID=1907202 RepID=UPI003299CD25
MDVLLEASGWADVPLDQLAQEAMRATLTHLDVPMDDSAASLMACDDARIADLNETFRDKPTPTNVLSWPAQELATGTAGAVPRKPEVDFDGTIELGDIAIAHETCVKEAKTLEKPLNNHVTHLIVHGILHLLGYDHIEDTDAALMQRLEAEILEKLGLDDPYCI